MLRKSEKMKKYLAVAFAVFMAVVMVVSAGAAVYADEYESDWYGADQTTDYFNVDYVVNEDNSYNITETVGVTFFEPHHGIFRYIPRSFNGIKEEVSGGVCYTDEYEVGHEDGCYCIRMGLPNKTITGPHEYKYGYNVTIIDDRDTSGDYLYVDLIPTNWEMPIAKSEVTVHLPKAVDENKITVYSGQQGSTADASNVEWKYNEDDNTIEVYGSDMEQGQGITLYIDLPEGYWVGQKTTDNYRIYAIIAFLVMLGLAVLFWIKFRPERNPVVTIEFYPPDGLTPAEVGTVIDGRADKKDMVSMFMYFASKGYMTIEQTEKKNFILRKVKKLDISEERFAHVLFNGVFADSDEVTLKELGDDVDFGGSYLAAQGVLEDMVGEEGGFRGKLFGLIPFAIFLVGTSVASYLVAAFAVNEAGIFVELMGLTLIMIPVLLVLRSSWKKRASSKIKGRRVLRILLWIIEGIFVTAMALLVGGAIGAIGGIACFASVAFAQIAFVYHIKETHAMKKYKSRLLGFREFIETAELDRINALVEEDPDYFYNVLPYAYVFNLTDKWASKFEKINIRQPDWYRDSYGSGTDVLFAMYMVSSMNRFSDTVLHNANAAVSDSIAASTDHGGGFGGGGGFSGGGFGGGGGGSW